LSESLPAAAVVDRLGARDGFDGSVGTRPLKRHIRRARAILAGELSSDSQRVRAPVGEDGATTLSILEPALA
jgi:hypothetical protein